MADERDTIDAELDRGVGIDPDRGPEQFDDPEQLTDEQAAEILQAVEEPPEQESPQQGVALTDEASQHQIDLRLLFMSIQQAREELATAKLAYHLSAAGLKGGPHGAQAKATVEEKLKQLDIVLTLTRHVEDKGNGIPLPSKLEVATEVPR